ncbi:hypothetical protein VOLCADRAFT_94069 [Volvox carteri f. nagariensis]|uniref:Uncharacterized protein n=1 Tax=Volvox carteri f. nagariensis TaxID=3068 RepID=D8U3U3_VOLCA|nr:uncharacterized protein VOLCADRAFT_94069 [Volvox carteri f. nagariensis]EFJ45588.1 hypothetical protein VOLCADRAFT_94069 [Volvox carteri f. nagariensis]|eukprot:XP_002953278.1 hypothetical protein VOLCADRAFT_94069 [Volvox carteri f. nagariensis]
MQHLVLVKPSSAHLGVMEPDGGWDVAGPEPVLEASFDGHADWVNDLALIGDLLITCSNDQTVRLWKAGSDNGQHLHTLSYHSDYVTCLAAAPARSLVVSAGLRAEIFLLNIEHVAKDAPGSVYALDLNPTGTVVAAGTSEALVRLLDPRIGKKITKLRGHQARECKGEWVGGADPEPTSQAKAGTGDSQLLPPPPPPPPPPPGYPVSGQSFLTNQPTNHILTTSPRNQLPNQPTNKQDTVRALLLNGDGTMLLSGASDGTIKLWDIGMQRCVQAGMQVTSHMAYSSTPITLSYKQYAHIRIFHTGIHL